MMVCAFINQMKMANSFTWRSWDLISDSVNPSPAIRHQNSSINYHYRKIAGTLSITQKAAAVPMLQIFCVNFMKREIKVL